MFLVEMQLLFLRYFSFNRNAMVFEAKCPTFEYMRGHQLWDAG